MFRSICCNNESAAGTALSADWVNIMGRGSLILRTPATLMAPVATVSARSANPVLRRKTTSGADCGSNGVLTVFSCLLYNSLYKTQSNGIWFLWVTLGRVHQANSRVIVKRRQCLRVPLGTLYPSVRPPPMKGGGFDQVNRSWNAGRRPQ
jgi:hypothetical protein